MKKLFIIETTHKRFTFYTIIEADDVQEAIDIKVAAKSTGTGTVTGATSATKVGYPFFGETMYDVELAPPPPPVLVPNKYVLTKRHQ